MPSEDLPATVDHTFAVMEINKAQVKALAAAEAKRRIEADEARAKAEEQVRGQANQSWGGGRTAAFAAVVIFLCCSGSWLLPAMVA